MHIANINFQNKVGKFGLSSGSKGSKEKKLIQDSLDFRTQKLENRIKEGKADSQDKEDFERFKNTKKVVSRLSVLEDNDKDFELLDDESNKITESNIEDIMEGIYQHIGVLEKDGSYLDTNYEKYWELRRIVDELGEAKMRFFRTINNPKGFYQRGRPKSSKI